jgi:hypothetical protein
MKMLAFLIARGLDLITADHFSGAWNAEIFSVLVYLPRLHQQA